MACQRNMMKPERSLKRANLSTEKKMVPGSNLLVTAISGELTVMDYGTACGIIFTSILTA